MDRGPAQQVVARPYRAASRTHAILRKTIVNLPVQPLAMVLLNLSEFEQKLTLSFGRTSIARRRYRKMTLATRGRRSRLIRQRKRDRYPILVTDGSRDMTFTRGVFSQVDVPWCHADLLTTHQFNLSLPAERNHVLSPGSVMPILNRSRRIAMQFPSGNPHQFENLVRTA